MMTPFAALEQIWTSAGCEPAALERVTLTGDDPMLPTDIRTGTACRAPVRDAGGVGAPAVPLGTHEPVWLA